MKLVLLEYAHCFMGLMQNQFMRTKLSGMSLIGFMDHLDLEQWLEMNKHPNENTTVNT